MVQHLNLLTRRKAKTGVTAMALAAVGLWAVLLAGVALHGEWQLQQQQGVLAQTRQSVSDLKAALENKRQDSGQQEHQAMARQLDLLRAQLARQRDWAELMQKGELGKPSGYSQWFETLATVHVDGVWLQGVEMGKEGQSVGISGKSLGADAVMRYIDRLNEAFKPMGVQPALVEIAQDASGDAASTRPVLSFKIH